MLKIFWQLLKTTPAIVGASVLLANSALAGVESVGQNKSDIEIQRADKLVAQAIPGAGESTQSDSETLKQIYRYSTELEEDSQGQINNVFQLRDVSPGDWAFEALRNLVERYGCIAGYPNSTYRGNRPLTRYEFAAGLNACMAQIERLIAGGSTPPSGDLGQLERLAQEFQAELATLGTRVDNLEGRTAFLEDNQFSTTTKLKGEVIFSLTGAFGDEQAVQTNPDGTITAGGTDIDENVTFSDRVRLKFVTSFTGKDLLSTRLQAGNFTQLDDVTGTDSARLGHDADGGNNIEIQELFYRFPLGDKIRVWVGTEGFSFRDVADVHNPFLISSGSGALSRFHRRNPFIFRNQADQGIGAKIELTEAIGLDVGYFTDDANDPSDTNGLFNGNLTAMGQLNFEPSDRFSVGLAGGYSYHPGSDVNLSGSTGSELAQRPFGDFATSAFHAGLQGSFRLTPGINIGGWFGYIRAEAEDGPNEGENADLINASVNVSFVDFGKEGAVLSFAGGLPPKVIESVVAEENDTSYIIEGLYKYPITKGITITPGAYVIFNPNHIDANDTIVVGTIRTTFKF